MAGMAELREIIRLVEESLDEPGLDAGELASRACLSRFHFDRLASAALGEPPGAGPGQGRGQVKPTCDTR
jgi:transcriptional regulator GlxA family with amidase domain